MTPLLRQRVRAQEASTRWGSLYISSGVRVSFWHDKWPFDDSLANRFPILYSHNVSDAATVQAVMGSELDSSSDHASRMLLKLSSWHSLAICRRLLCGTGRTHGL